MNSVTTRNALTILKEIQARNAEWLEQCEQDRKDGYRPHYCSHGVNMWENDFDCACWRCEEYGFYPDPMIDRQQAIAIAQEYDRKVSDLITAGATFKASLSDPVAATSVWDLVILEAEALKQSYGL